MQLVHFKVCINLFLLLTNAGFLNNCLNTSFTESAFSISIFKSFAVSSAISFAREPILEYDQSNHPFRKDLLETPIVLENGYVNVSDNPGLGIKVNTETIKKYKIN